MIKALIWLMPFYSTAQELRMATFGDSLSAGVFADGGGLRQKTVGQLDLKKWLIGSVLEAPKYVYSDGDNIESVKRRLIKIGYTVKSDNYSVSGATSHTMLTEQVKKAVESGKSYDIAFVMIGANDLGIQADVRQAIENTYWAVRTLALTTKHVYPIMLPKFYNLNEKVKDKRNIFFLKCSFVWDLVGILKPLTVLGGKMKEANMKWITTFNEELRRMDGGNVHVVTEAGDFDIEPKYVSNKDCVHSSKQGHEELARIVFKKVKETL
jgi:lysophospholipase L1-like esterase